ncbi:hypothetical protein AeRB84_005975, partial [Aphanomyces euteiches]
QDMDTPYDVLSSPEDPHLTSKRRPNLRDSERRAIFERLLETSTNGVLRICSIAELATQYKRDRDTISRIWQRGMQSRQQGDGAADVAARIRGNSGRKPKRNRADIETAIRQVKHEQRQTMRSLAMKTCIPMTTMHRFKQAEKHFSLKSNWLKSSLTNDNMKLRLDFAMSFLRPGPRVTHVFSNKNTYYVFDNEEMAQRSTKSKSHITKVMFLVAVARPRYDHAAKKLFDGKLGVWPFVTQERAQRGSKNRPKGTLETKPINVDGDVYQEKINEVIPALLNKMPKAQLQKGVWIQQDNTSPHRTVTTKFVSTHLDTGGFSIEKNQPPNSPDYNVLNLGFFNAIQSLQHQKSTRTIDEMIDAVVSAFSELPVETLSKTFLTLQKVMEQSISMGGNNSYKLPHMKKDKTIQDFTTFNLVCNDNCYENALAAMAARIDQERRLEVSIQD